MLLPLFDGGLLCQLALWLLSRGFGKLWPLERDGFGFLDALLSFSITTQDPRGITKILCVQILGLGYKIGHDF
jgi:hypothetical protein